MDTSLKQESKKQSEEARRMYVGEKIKVHAGDDIVLLPVLSGARKFLGDYERVLTANGIKFEIMEIEQEGSVDPKSRKLRGIKTSPKRIGDGKKKRNAVILDDDIHLGMSSLGAMTWALENVNMLGVDKVFLCAEYDTQGIAHFSPDRVIPYTTAKRLVETLATHPDLSKGAARNLGRIGYAYGEFEQRPKAEPVAHDEWKISPTWLWSIPDKLGNDYANDFWWKFVHNRIARFFEECPEEGLDDVAIEALFGEPVITEEENTLLLRSGRELLDVAQGSLNGHVPKTIIEEMRKAYREIGTDVSAMPDSHMSSNGITIISRHYSEPYEGEESRLTGYWPSRRIGKLLEIFLFLGTGAYKNQSLRNRISVRNYGQPNPPHHPAEMGGMIIIATDSFDLDHFIESNRYARQHEKYFQAIYYISARNFMCRKLPVNFD